MQKIKEVQKLTENPFLNLYHIDALDAKGRPFHYYFASRNRVEDLKLKTKLLDAEGIVVFALTKESSPRLVLIREYRYPLDEFVYALPAGLTDPGESSAMAAVREMKEETGLNFEEYTGGDTCFRRPFFMGPGFTDETSSAVFGYVQDITGSQQCEPTEQIQLFLADKKQVRRILSEEKVSLRCAYLMMQYLQMDAKEPYRFLNQE